MSIKCLMIETPDKKRLFTSVGSRRQLAECCRAFNAKLYTVKASIKRSQLMTVPKLVVALCEKTNKKDETEFEVLDSGAGEQKTGKVKGKKR
jgi:hypothetical protein